ncbi:MAG: D-glycero-beta-D-manno-heptose 1-phosphate adenylyltransferase [Bacteroidota bacterium]|nr:D-glycero-beta-D-manno-heptose 1-phosphate adenylyltransferase [Bacteroidota bacterium]
MGENQTIVFTNGCFDLLHLGHIDYLTKASRLGSKLIVGLNSDKSVKELKGTSRPIQCEKSRASILAALECVDAVVLFDEQTPLEIIRKIKPDVLVKGADYAIHEIIGGELVLKNGGLVKTIPFLEGYSTSNIIDKIQNG